MTDAERKEKLLRLWVEHEKQYDIFATYEKYKVMYGFKTIHELIKILQKAGVGPAEIDKIMEGE